MILRSSRSSSSTSVHKRSLAKHARAAMSRPNLSLLLPTDDSSRLSTQSNNDRIINSYMANEELAGGHSTSLRSSSPASSISPSSEYAELPNLKRRSLSSRSISREALHEDVLTPGWVPHHRTNTSGGSSADLGVRWPYIERADSSSATQANTQGYADSHANLMHSISLEDTENGLPINEEDDSDHARLTSNIAFSPFDRVLDGQDRDRHAFPPVQQSRGRRATILSTAKRKDSDAYSPARVSRQQSLLSTAARGLRRMSVRVVNLANHDHDNTGHVKLEDDADMSYSDFHDTKAMPADSQPQMPIAAQDSSTLLTGKALGVFGPDNFLRKMARRLLLYRWTEPAILILIIAYVVVLTVQASPSVFSHPRPSTAGYFFTWTDYALFALMLLFTLEACARILVSGLLRNSDNPLRQLLKKDRSVPTVPLSARLRNRFSVNALAQRFSPHHPLPPQYYHSAASRETSEQSKHSTADQTSSDIFHKRAASAAANLLQDTPFRLAVARQRAATSAQSAYLRHSWNRIDLLAITCFWISFVLAVTGTETREHLYIFRALSVLRAVRLLTFTAGTTTILQSLKQAGPLLVNVAFFVVFAIILFSVVGIQAFKGSFSRQCVWIDPEGASNYSTGQVCGGYLNSDGQAVSYLAQDSSVPNPDTLKGFLCPIGQVCIEGENPWNGTQSFDNIAAAALQIIVIASSNNWTPPMYDMMSADYFISCLYFIICLIVLNYWLINMFVAVITNTFGSIMDESKHSAFASSAPALILDQSADPVAATGPNSKKASTSGWLLNMNKAAKYFWVLLVVASVTSQATKRNNSSERHLAILKWLELGFTAAFDVEIALRLGSEGRNWKRFFKSTSNLTDLVLAIVTTFIQLPFFRNSSAYAWFTAFQLARFYRVMLAIPRIKRLLIKLTGSISGLINMIFFLVLMTFVAALMAVQLLRGIIPDELDGEEVEMSFYQIYNGFLAIYQVLSSEDWTVVLSAATISSGTLFQVVMSAMFISGWFIFANFILVRMFIAVISEGFAVAEGEKHKQQLDRFVKYTQPKVDAKTWVDRLNVYNYIKAKPRGVTAEALPAAMTVPLQKAVVRDLMSGSTGLAHLKVLHQTESSKSSPRKKLFQMARSKSSLSLLDKKEPAAEEEDADEDDLDRHLHLLVRRGTSEIQQEAAAERRAQQIDFINAHPTYDKSLWIFSQRNPLRRICQSMVEPAVGHRILGHKPRKKLVKAFDAIIFLVILASIVIAAIATPLYRKSYFEVHGDIRWTWFNLTEVVLGLFFLFEFLVKIIADGFLFAPNAYLRSIWNDIDFFVLLTIIVNVVTALLSGGGVSKTTRAFKAFRALRLINLSKQIRVTFYEVLILGAARLFDASLLAILYIIPYAVWGQNLFSGLLYSCNDGLATHKNECIGEYLSSPLEWEFLAPRAWANPYVWSFDSFRSSFLILFEIISLEGWINVLTSAMAIVGLDDQPSQDASQYNSIFFIIYNLVGGLLVLSLFVSIIIENFTQRSGMSLLTSEQRQWIDLRKLIKRQRPSRRPRFRPADPFRAWCFDRAVQKHGWWSRTLTCLYVLHIVILMTQTDYDTLAIINVRDFVFLFLNLLYFIDIGVRMIGVGWQSFRQNWWNLYTIVVVVGTFGSTIPLLRDKESELAVQTQKLFLVSIAFLLVQKNNALNQLFKTAVASLPAIMNLFLLWAILFLVYAIAYIEIFSLTRWGENGTYNANFSTFSKAIVLLVLTSTGEAWNSFMHDYTVEPPFCSPNPNFLFDDCGSPGWSYGLFITWNILSMYIFVNMFTGVVVENFSYVFQLYGRVKTINREEMRAFKKTFRYLFPCQSFARYDAELKYYTTTHQRLSGVFDVKIFPPEARIPTLVKECQNQSHRDRVRESRLMTSYQVDNYSSINVAALNRRLGQVDYTQVAARRSLYNHLYHEALLTEEAGKGISFTNMLLLLAHYKLMDDNHALQIDELLQRNAKLSKVNDLMSLDKVRGLLATIHYRRAFLAYREQNRKSFTQVPEITISGGQDSPKLGGGRGSPSLSPITPSTSPFRFSRSQSPSSDQGDCSPRPPSREEERDEGALVNSLNASKWNLVDEDDDK